MIGFVLFLLLTPNLFLYQILIFKAKLLEANETNIIAHYLDVSPEKIDTNGNREIEIAEALKIAALFLDNSNMYHL